MGRDVRFTREPYTVTYYTEGEKHTIRRVPPPKLHSALPEDKVELTTSKNADFRAGETFEVKSISPRQPNVLQIVNEEGLSTFVDHYDAKLVSTAVDNLLNEGEAGKSADQAPIDSSYLLWP